MAFNLKNLEQMPRSTTGNNFKYVTDDDRYTVSQAGYFDLSSVTLNNPGNATINCLCPNHSFVAIVSSDGDCLVKLADRTYQYFTADTIADVTASGYFAGKNYSFDADESIKVQAPDGPYEVQLVGGVASVVDSRVYGLKVGEYNVSSSYELLESGRLSGAGRQIPTDEANGKSTIINNSTGSSTVIVDGSWSGFDSRRFITIDNFSINSTGGSQYTVYCDFMTIFEISNLFAYGDSDYTLYLINSYNGSVKGSRLYGADVANMVITNDDANSVFSGQMYFEDCDFWYSSNGTNDGAGVIIEANTNLIEQVQFDKCHFQHNDIGFWQKTPGRVTFNAAHFEANNEHDLLTDSGSDNPIINSAFCNNAVTTSSCFELNGNGGWISCDFINVTNGAYCIDVGADCTGLSLCDIDILRKSGATMSGINVGGTDVEISNVSFRTAGSAATWNAITFESGARNVRVSGVSYENFGSAAPMVDNGAENIIFEDALIVDSAEFDLDGGVQTDAIPIAFRGYVNRAWIVCTEASGAGTTAITVGRSVSPGAADYSRYVDGTTSASAGLFSESTLTVKSTNFISATDVLIFRCAGDAAVSGKVKLRVEITPYRALT